MRRLGFLSCLLLQIAACATVLASDASTPGVRQRDVGDGRFVVAQATPAPSAETSANSRSSGSDWVTRAGREYQEIMRKLSRPALVNPVADAAKRLSAERGGPGTTPSGAQQADTHKLEPKGGADSPPSAVVAESGVLEQGLDWVHKTSREYQEIMRQLSQPAGRAPTAGASKTPESKTSRATKEGDDKRVEPQVASKPADGQKKDDEPKVVDPSAEQRRLAELRREDEAKRAEEARRAAAATQAEEAKKAEEARLAAEAQKAAEAKKAAEAEDAKKSQEQAADAARRAAQAAAKVAEETARLAKERLSVERKAADEARKAARAAGSGKDAETQRTTDAKRGDEALRAAEIARAAQRAEQAIRSAQFKIQNEERKAEAAKKAAEAARKSAETASTPAQKRAAEKLAAQQARRAAEAAKRAEAATRVASSITVAPQREKAESQDSVRRPSTRALVARRERDCPHAGDDIQPPGWYIVRQGDTLWGIAARFYQQGHRYRLIHKANARRIASAGRIRACQRIYLPKLLRRA